MEEHLRRLPGVRRGAGGARSRCRRCWTGCARADLEPVAVTPSPELYDRVVAAAGPAAAPAVAAGWLLVAAALVAVLGIGAGVTWWLTG